MYGFLQVRQRGSHIIMQQQTEDSTITVPVPNYDELRVGTLRSYYSPVRIATRSF
ncbi:type II toxin-antitoxin system HicA family toxin [Nostoc sp.]|uniref:type II toxin-antitoxin system HicA family toxin n=1 Tax=Nostoc sp. TaxID=1180 RepID=UPI002FF6E1DC